MSYIKTPKVLLKAATVSFELPLDYPDYKPHADGEVASADELVEFAGRMCYQSWSNPGGKSNAEYINHIRSVGHGSVLEHANFTLSIEGISRSLTHELVRHRAGFAFSQLSQRYVSEDERQLVVPPKIEQAIDLADLSRFADMGALNPVLLDPDQRQELDDYVAACQIKKDFAEADEVRKRLYKSLTENFSKLFDSPRDPLKVSGLAKTDRRKAARGTARSVLPNCQETRIVVTANGRAWRHFIEMRGSQAADEEIRRLAVAIWKVLVERAPGIFGDYQIVTLPDGTEALETPHRKV